MEQILRTMAVDVDNIRVEKLGYVEYAINSSVNASTSNATFELVYRTNIRIMVDQLDSVHYIKNA